MSGNLSDQNLWAHNAPPPVVSVVMANYQGAAHLASAMASVLSQSERRLELIVVDDASGDDSVAIARAIAATDDRVQVIASVRNAGPAATRNLGLDAARGEWVAIVDSDDLIYPERLERLIAAATAADVGLVADDLVYFGADSDPQGRTLLQSLGLSAPMMLGPATYLRSNDGKSGLPSYGYLKPIIRRSVLSGLRYDVGLRIGEDHDLVLRMLIAGARLLVVPDPLYAYRRHGASISHRLSIATVAAMLKAHRSLPAMSDPAMRSAVKAVDRHLRRALRYEQLVADIKARRWQAVLPRLFDPAMIVRLVESLRDRRRKTKAFRDVATAPSPISPMPLAGESWMQPPAQGAARIAAMAARGDGLPLDAPAWAAWLFHATLADTSA